MFIVIEDYNSAKYPLEISNFANHLFTKKMETLQNVCYCLPVRL